MWRRRSPPCLPAISVTAVDTTAETIALTPDAACWAGHSIYPFPQMDEGRMVAIVQKYGGERVLVNSAADGGVSDPLTVPKTAQAMKAAGVADAVIETICWSNPVSFFAQSNRLDLEGPKVDQRELWEGNSVLRGQTPQVDQ